MRRGRGRGVLLLVLVSSVVASVLSLEVWQPQEVSAHPEAPRQVCDAGFTLRGSICERTSTERADASCDAGYTLRETTYTACVKTTTEPADASCRADYTLRGDTCERTVTSTERAVASCDAGYTLRETTYTACVKTTTEPADASCRADYTLRGDTCERTVTSTERAVASCDAGFSLRETTYTACVKTTTEPADASCRADYTLRGDTCERTVTSTERAVASCDAGFSLRETTYTACVKTTATAASASCGAGYSLATVGGSKTCQRLYTATPVCSGGRRFVPPNSCVNLTTLAVSSPRWDCGNGFSTGGTGCVTYAAPTYTCTSGTLSGRRCLITKYGKVSYTCSQGTLKFTRAGALCYVTTTVTADPTYTCTSGTLSGRRCLITKYGKVSYTCSQGTLKFTRAGALCYVTTTVTADPTYTCTSGTLSGRRCLITKYGKVSYTCSQGTLKFTRAGALCYVTTTVTADPTYTCTSGTLSGRRCLITKYGKVSYTCSQGTLKFTRAGALCYITVTDNPTDECPAEHTLTAGTCQPDDPDTTTTTTTTAPPDTTTTTTAPPDTTTTTTAPPVRVLIEDYAGSFRTGPGTMTATFKVMPADATCRALLLGRTADRASISPPTGVTRTVTVKAVAVGDLNVYVYCTHAILKYGIEKAVFTVLDPTCSQDITSGAQTAELTDQQWTTGCTSSQRGNSQIPYYAKRYTFSLTAAAQVTASVSSDQAINVYLLSDPHPDDTDPHASGTTQASAPLLAGDYMIEVARIKPRLTDGDFSLTVTVTTNTRPEPITANECITDLGILSVVGRAYDTRSAAWTQGSSCASRNRPATRYAEYFTFTLAAESIITIDLTSKHNTYLFLLNGHDNKQGYRQSNDDIGGTGGDRNSRLYGRLAAGEYTIEATTHNEDISGDFNLRIELMTGGFCPAPGGGSSVRAHRTP